MLRTWFTIIMAFKNVLFNRNTGPLQTFQKHQLATAEETSQEGCTPCVELLISAKRHFLPNHILSLEDNKKKLFTTYFSRDYFSSLLYTYRMRRYKVICFQTKPTLEFLQR